MKKVAIAMFITLVLSLATIRLQSQKPYNRYAPYEGNFMMFIVKTDAFDQLNKKQFAAIARQVTPPQIVTTDRKIYTEGEAVGYPSY